MLFRKNSLAFNADTQAWSIVYNKKNLLVLKIFIIKKNGQFITPYLRLRWVIIIYKKGLFVEDNYNF